MMRLPITPEIEQEARRLCFANCRAKLCEDRGECLGRLGGKNAGFLPSYHAEAIKNMETNMTREWRHGWWWGVGFGFTAACIGAVIANIIFEALK